MALSVTVSMSSVSGSLSVSGSKSYSGGGRVTLNSTIADSVTDQQHVVAIDVSQIQSIVIVSTQNITLETNSASVPADTIAIIAEVPYVWNTDQYFVNLLTTDITAFYLTNASGSTATVQMECVYDDTP